MRPRHCLCRQAVRQRDMTETESLPLADCPDSCNRHGYCGRRWKDKGAQPACLCHRGYGVSPAQGAWQALALAGVLAGHWVCSSL